MKTIIKFLALLFLASVPLFFATAKPGDAPGIQRKSLQIFDVSVATTESTATISWETNVPSSGSVQVGDHEILDDKTGTRHSVTIPALVGGIEYHFRVVAFSEVFGPAATYDVSFRL